MKIIIFGVGERGKAVFSYFHKEEIVAFIDNDSAKTGKEYEGKKIISIEEYKKYYSQYFIFIGVHNSAEIKNQLEKEGIIQYFDSIEWPIELQIRGNEERFRKYVLSHIEDKKKTYGIYGVTVYSLYLYERLKEEGYKKIFIIPEADINEERFAKAKEAFGESIFGDTKFSYDKILFAINKMHIQEELQKRFGQDMEGMEIVDVFDNMKAFPDYKNIELKKFNNINLNEKCFIVATGPSLRMTDLDILEKNQIKTISMNRIYIAFEKTRWRPDYYICTDRFLIEEWENDINKLPLQNKFIGDRYSEFWNRDVPENLYKIHIADSQVTDEYARFSDDIVSGIYSAGTVTYACIQLAVYMGFKEIYLLGVDHNLSSNVKEKSNHFAPDYYSNESRVNNKWNFLNIALKEYMAAKKYADLHEIKIYNATRGGKLEVFERVCFDELFA